MATGKETVLNAGCKVNLYLNILGSRKDGYHELESLFFPLTNPGDKLVISPGSANTGISIQSSLSELDGQNNILAKAYQVFAETSGCRPDLHVQLEKNIPVGAGLGGGSSDAATLITYLLDNCSGSAHLNKDDVLKMALKVGADVPFFLFNKPAWVTGIGEIFTPVNLDFSGHFLLLITPDKQISTAWAYRAWDEKIGSKELGNQKQNCLTRMPTEIKEISLTSQYLFWNSFEELIFNYYPELRDIKKNVMSLGARRYVLSGSGSAMVALCEQNSNAHQVLNYLRDRQIKYYTHQF